MNLVELFYLLGAIFFFVVFWWSLYSFKDHFFSDTLFLSLFGIYVRGDGIIIAPFLSILCLLSWHLGLILTQFFMIFMIFLWFRSFFEVIYWLMHQFAKKDFVPVLLRSLPGNNSEKSAIIYQLLHTVLLILLPLMYWLIFLI